MNSSIVIPAVFAFFVLIFPAFGGGLSEQPILFIVVVFSLAYILISFDFFSGNVSIPFYFFLLMELFLIIAWSFDIFYGIAGLSDIPSLFRAAGMAFMYLSFFVLFNRNKIIASVFLDYFVVFSFFILCLFFILSMTFSGYPDFVARWYFPQERFKENAFLSVFASTYFAAYFYYIIYAYSMCRLFFFEVNFKWVCVSLGSMVFVFLSQGKTAYLSVFITFFLILFIRSKMFFKILLLVLLVFSALFFLYYFDYMRELLLRSDFYSLKQLSIILDGGFESVSVSERIEQIIFSINSSLDHYMLSVGLGRGIYLESFAASYIYRYGVLGFSVYCFFYIYIGFKAYRVFNKGVDFNDRLIGAFIFVWVFNLPFLMLSNPMFEMGKNSIFSILLVSLFFYNSRYPSRKLL
ncbi:hypothetical protein [Denitrificimonas caeni]|uniref:Uncharacterized protein n=1 Tax=Denitrificimonas caeni TaxID=521720 RepID=A0AAE9VNP8_9GAMM|nr:hypothetical protein [Denitrificimonas caeni]WBE25072.1 hypothetical protein O6P33_12040 [Denitrificimonas caeni]